MITQDEVGSDQFVKQVGGITPEFWFAHQWYYTRTMSFAAKQHQYWNDLSHSSMPDKHLVALEIQTIKKLVGQGKLLDVGCGEGENTRKFSQIKGVKVIGVDYAPNRLKLAKKECPNIKFVQADLTKKLNSARFSRTLGSLLAGGVSLTEAIKITADTLTNVYYRRAVLATLTEVEKGQTISSLLTKSPDLFPPVVTEMIAVGEETGSLNLILKKLARFF